MLLLTYSLVFSLVVVGVSHLWLVLLFSSLSLFATILSRLRSVSAWLSGLSHVVFVIPQICIAVLCMLYLTFRLLCCLISRS